MKPIYKPTGKAKEYGEYAINIYTGCPLEQEVKKQVLLENEKYERSLDVFFIYCLHDVFGFGNNRIKRLYEKMLDIRNEMKARYKADEEENSSDYLFAMEKQLKDCGIDVDEILKEVQK